MFGTSSPFGQTRVLPPVRTRIPAVAPVLAPEMAVRVLLFAEPGPDRDACLEDLGPRGGAVQVAGLRILIRMLLQPDGRLGLRLTMDDAEAPRLVVVLDDHGVVPAPPPVSERYGALWVRIGRDAASASEGEAPWDRDLVAPVDPAVWTEILAEAGGASLFRRRSMADPAVRDAWMRYLARVSRDPRTAPPRAAPGAGGEARVLRVLLVEDDPVVAQVTRRRLERERVRVEVARGHGAAMRRFRDQPWDLVLADIRLGLDSGLHLVTEMRELEAQSGRERARILAFGEAPEGREAVDRGDSGFDGRLPKPVSDAELRDLLRNTPRRAADVEEGRAREELRVRAEARRILGDEVPRLVGSLRAALEGPSREGLARLRALAHRLQGTAAVVGDPALRQAACLLESVLGSASGPDAAPVVRSAVDRLVLHLERSPRPLSTHTGGEP